MTREDIDVCSWWWWWWSATRLSDQTGVSSSSLCAKRGLLCLLRFRTTEQGDVTYTPSCLGPAVSHTPTRLQPPPQNIPPPQPPFHWRKRSSGSPDTADDFQNTIVAGHTHAQERVRTHTHTEKHARMCVTLQTRDECCLLSVRYVRGTQPLITSIALTC